MLLQKKQHTVTRGKEETELIARGRHDPCVVPRGIFLNNCSFVFHKSGTLILVCIWCGSINAYYEMQMQCNVMIVPTSTIKYPS